MQSIYRTLTGEQVVMELYNSLLAQWRVPFTIINVPTRYGNTSIIASGDETLPPLVLLHGAGTNSTMWIGDVAGYSSHYRILAIDLLGEPGKSASSRPSWDGPAYVQWLEEVFTALKLEKVALLGLSQGGWTALKFAVARPERVSALVLLSPGGITPDKASFLLRILPLSLLGNWGSKRINHIVLAGQTVPVATEEAMTLIRKHFKPRLGKLPLFSNRELRQLHMPVQLIMGKHDALRNAEAIKARMMKLVPQIKVTIIPEAGHAIVHARPHIMPFLSKALLSFAPEKKL